MHRIALAFLVASMTASFAATDPMAARFGNTTLVLDTVGTVTRVFFDPAGSFLARRGGRDVHGVWRIENASLCLHYHLPPHGPDETECYVLEPHAVGDVWLQGRNRITLVKGIVDSDTPEVLAAVAAASRVGNTVVAKDPDGTETRIFWRPDHTFAATRPGWKTEGTWAVKGSSLFLHYNIPRPAMGSDEEMKNATPRRVGEVWGMADRQVTLIAGEHLTP